MSLSESDTSDLLELTEKLVSIPSVSGNEAMLADEIEKLFSTQAPSLQISRMENSIIARSNRGLPIRVVLAGHLDTVPPQDNEKPRRADDVLFGLGSADMKSGLAVMLLLATQSDAYGVDTTYLFYDGEEVTEDQNGLQKALQQQEELVHGNLAILLEPTNNTLEVGCQGSLTVRVSYSGRRAHAARPHLGANAIHKLANPISEVTKHARVATLDGLEYRESMQVVSVEGGVARNVIPDAASLEVNYRFAPDRSLEEAKGELGKLFADGELEIVDFSPAAVPALSHPLIAQFAGSLDLAVRPKLAWTDVARFAAVGIPAVNFGPGDPEHAHRADEQVSRAALESSARLLTHYLRDVAGHRPEDLG